MYFQTERHNFSPNFFSTNSCKKKFDLLVIVSVIRNELNKNMCNGGGASSAHTHSHACILLLSLLFRLLFIFVEDPSSTYIDGSPNGNCNAPWISGCLWAAICRCIGPFLYSLFSVYLKKCTVYLYFFVNTVSLVVETSACYILVSGRIFL